MTERPRAAPASRGRLEAAYRVAATGFCFAFFGTGGLLLRLLVFPLVSLFIRQPERRTLVSRRLIHHTWRFFVWLMRAVGVITVEVRGLERLQRRGLLVLPNHPTLIDVVILVSLMPDVSCVVKSSLLANPFTRGPVRAARYVCNDAGMALIGDGLAALAEGNSLIIFPEGTRTPQGEAIKLLRGAANVAVRARVDVTPVVIRCEPLMLGKGQKWYDVPPRPGHFTIEVREDVAIERFLEGAASEPLAARRLTQWLEHFFHQEARRGGD